MRTPIYTALQNYRRRHNWRLHMPGHAGCARGLPSGLKSLAAWDFTELPGLDDWHAPWGIIQESEKAAGGSLWGCGGPLVGERFQLWFDGGFNRTIQRAEPGAAAAQ